MIAFIIMLFFGICFKIREYLKEIRIENLHTRIIIEIETFKRNIVCSLDKDNFEETKKNIERILNEY